MTEQVLGHRQEFLQVGLDPQLGLQGQVSQEDADGGPQALGHDGDVVAAELTALFPGTFYHIVQSGGGDGGGGGAGGGGGGGGGY